MRLRLILVAVVLLAGWFTVPVNYRIRKTMELYLTGFPEEWSFYRRHRDPAKRERLYNQLNFSIPQNIAQLLAPGDVVAIPPRSYLLRFFPEKQTRWAEPRFMVYAAGPLHAVPWDKANWAQVTHGVVVAPGNPPQVSLRPVRTPADVDGLKALYAGTAAP